MQDGSFWHNRPINVFLVLTITSQYYKKWEKWMRIIKFGANVIFYWVGVNIKFTWHILTLYLSPISKYKIYDITLIFIL